VQVGLFFGSFNPIHVGHLIIAQAMVDHAALGEVWFVVSPHNPHKSSKSLIHEFDRIDMVEAAISDNDRFKACDVEFNMPRPSYTITTLAHLQEKYSNHKFRLIIGEDNLHAFPKWRNSSVILRDFGLLVYPRPGADPSSLKNHPNVQYVTAPMLDISATYIRAAIKAGMSIRYLVPHRTAQFIYDRKLYH
jgi:nicotinate-nucleotide adenylyltransferase